VLTPHYVLTLPDEALLSEAARDLLDDVQEHFVDQHGHFQGCVRSFGPLQAHRHSLRELARVRLHLCCSHSPRLVLAHRLQVLGAGLGRTREGLLAPQEFEPFASRLGTPSALDPFDPWRAWVSRELDDAILRSRAWFAEHALDYLELLSAVRFLENSPAAEGASPLAGHLLHPAGPLEGLRSADLGPDVSALRDEVITRRSALDTPGSLLVLRSEASLAAVLALDAAGEAALEVLSAARSVVVLTPALADLVTPYQYLCDDLTVLEVPLGEPPAVLETLTQVLSDGVGAGDALEVARALSA
jgi:hypothetical protein